MTQLAVIRGLTYTNFSQVFNRWLIPTYRGAFRWTGNRVDAEDVTSWTILNSAHHIHFPDLVQLVDDQVVDATLEALTRHWVHRYGIAPITCAEIDAFAATPTPESVFDGLTGEQRHLLVLRFMRRRSPAAIAAQLRISPDAARRRIIAGLALVAKNIGLRVASGELSQASQVSSYLDDLIARRRPLRFEARPEAWPAMVAAGHLQAAIAGNDLPKRAFVRSLERKLQAGWGRRFVTDVRIWSA